MVFLFPIPLLLQCNPLAATPCRRIPQISFEIETRIRVKF
jgi:hypothetical protein